MAVIKRSKSGAAFQVVLSEDLPAGTILQVSYSQAVKLPSGGKFWPLTILPIPARPNQFPKSKVYGQEGETVIPVFNGNGGLDKKSRDDVVETRMFVDKEVDL